jgi:hypothetical protein
VPLWTLDRLERGDEDPGPHLSAIAEATGQRYEVLRARPDEGSETAEAPSTAVEGSDDAPSQWVRNIVLGSVAALVLIRYFTEDLGVLPRALKLVDIPILFVLLLMSMVAPRTASSRSPTMRYLLPGVAFLALCTLSLLVNSGRIEPAPAFLFMYGFLAPIAVFYCVWHLWPTGQALAFSRLLVALACVEFAVVAFGDVPEYIRTKNPDYVSGTFGENAYQLVFFLLMCSALVAGIMTTERRRLAARLAPFFFAATAGTILLAQYRAILLTGALALLLIATLLGLVRVRGAIAGVVVAVVFALGVAIVPAMFPELKLQKTLSTLSGSPGSYVSERLEAGGDVANLYTDMPAAILIGSGPGTFSSRAWETFADSPAKSSASLGVKLPFSGSKKGYTTDVSERYTIQRLQNQKAIEGSFALVQPFSSYYALLAEVGLLGFILIVVVYGRAFIASVRMSLTALRLAPDGDPLPGLLLASTVGFFVLLQMAILENWWEVTRLTFIAWTLLAVATKEFEAKYGPGSSEGASV